MENLDVFFTGEVREVGDNDEGIPIVRLFHEADAREVIVLGLEADDVQNVARHFGHQVELRLQTSVAADQTRPPEAAARIANKVLETLRGKGLDCVSGSQQYDVSREIHTAVLFAARDILRKTSDEMPRDMSREQATRLVDNLMLAIAAESEAAEMKARDAIIDAITQLQARVEST